MTTQTTTTAPDSWEARINQFANIVGLSIEEVEAAFAEKPFELTKDTPFVLEMLSDDEVTPFGDIRKLFSDDRDVSLPKLRMGIKYLRGTKEQRETATSTVDPTEMGLYTKYGIKTRLEDIPIEELITAYDPKNRNRIFDTLKKEFGDKPVVAFKPDSKVVAVEETVNYITDIRDDLPEEEAIDVDGELVRLYPIGKVPHETVEEDPMFSGNPLKRGRSTVNRINWSNVDQPVRQLVRIIVERGEANPNDRMAARDLFKMANSMDDLKETFPEAYMEYKERKQRDELPKLILSLDEVNGRVNNPFGINRSY